MYCSNRSCAAFINLQKIPPSLGTVVICPKCPTQLCRSCKTEFHSGLSCQIAQALKRLKEKTEEDYVAKFAKDNGWQKCPGCKAVVSLTQGCNHMSCRCG